MRQIFPEPAEVDLAEAYRSPRDWIRANMVSSLDGAATMSGRVGRLTGSADQQVLIALRRWADVLLVGAGTIRAEGYGPVDSGAPLAVITNSGQVLDAPIFGGRVAPIILLPARCLLRDELAARARVLTVGETTVSMADAIAALRAEGFRRILSEGGPHALADLIAADLLDELCLTISPLLYPGDAGRITAGDASAPTPLRLARLFEADGHLFARYGRAVPRPQE